MKILFVCNNFNYLSGSPLYVYELTRVLAKRGHEITLASEFGGIIAEKAVKNGVKLIHLSDLNRDMDFDIIHCQQSMPTSQALARTKDTIPAIATIHSEYGYEDPFVHPRIKKWIAIRPSIKQKLIDENGIPDDLIEVVYNPVDPERFNTKPTDPFELPTIGDKKLVLFVGTIDPLRRAAALDLIEKSKKEDFEILFVGQKFDNYLEGELPQNISWIPEQWDIDKFVKECDETAGILYGRTTIEGWMCGKPGWIYDVDLQGQIKSVELHQPPADVHEKHDAELVADRIIKQYESVLSHQG